jgi:hypothetical protein
MKINLIAQKSNLLSIFSLETPEATLGSFLVETSWWELPSFIIM